MGDFFENGLTVGVEHVPLFGAKQGKVDRLRSAHSRPTAQHGARSVEDVEVPCEQTDGIE